MSQSIDAAGIAEPQMESRERVSDSSLWQAGVVGGAVVLLWLEVIKHLRAEWTINPQYEYGWSVPFLAAYLFYRRWSDRPAAGHARSMWLVIAIASVASLLLLPARIISIANPDWRLLSWALASAAVTISLCSLYLLGGLPWVRHFGFCAAFILVATPWPALFEQNVVQALMRADSAMVVKILNLIGTIAIQRGNVIELSTGLVGIADACTGIRSLQSTLMISLFLGEYFRMNFRRRVLLIVAAALLAFICNLGRTLLLCLIASSSSVDAIHTWHDSAGLTILLICIVCLWILSAHMSKGQPALVTTSSSMPRLDRFWPFAFALILWIGATELTAAAWYGRQDKNAEQASSWSVNWPEQQSNYTEAKIPDEAKDLLAYDDGGGASWTGTDNHRWLIYYFHWLPGRTAARFVKFHRPDICLPASGMKMTHANPIKLLKVGDVSLPVRSYLFENRGTPIHVFYCYWDARSSYETAAAANEEDWSARGRIRAALSGRRELGAKMLELVVWGYSDESSAAAAFEQQLASLIQHKPGL